MFKTRPTLTALALSCIALAIPTPARALAGPDACNAGAVVASIPLPGMPTGAVIGDSIAYIAIQPGGTPFLSVFDLTTPDHPTHLGDTDLPDGFDIDIRDPTSSDDQMVATDHALFLSGRIDGVPASLVYDVTDPAAPLLVSSETVTRPIRAATALGDTLVVASNPPPRRFQFKPYEPVPSPEIELIDLSTPAAPETLAVVPMRVETTALAARGDALYAGIYGVDIILFDVSDPTAPSDLGRLSSIFGDRFDSGALKIDADTLYAWQGVGFDLVRFDITDPLNPRSPQEIWVDDFPLDNASELEGIHVHDGAALLSLFFVDLERPLLYEPNEFGATGAIVPTPTVGDPEPIDINTLFAASEGPTVVVGAESDFYGGFVALVCDLTRVPRTWTRSSYLDESLLPPPLPPFFEISGLELVGDTLYITSPNFRALIIADVSDSSRPRFLSYIRRNDDPPGGPSLTRPTGVKVREGIAYVADEAGVFTIDVSDPSAPLILGLLDSSFVDLGNGDSLENLYPLQIEVVPPYVYVADVNLFGMMIIDATDPAAPTYVSHVHLNSQAYEVQVVGNLAYVTTDSGLNTIDITDPANPVVLFNADEPSNEDRLSLWEVQIEGDLAYASARDEGLAVFDVSDPAAPQLLATAPSPRGGDSRAVHVEGCRAFITAYGGADEGLTIFDVSDPLAPQVIAHHPTPQDALELVVDEGVVFIGDIQGSVGLYVVDTVNPRPCRVDLRPAWGILDFVDVLAFVVLWADREPEADLDFDFDHDFEDVLIYLQEFGAGCE